MTYRRLLSSHFLRRTLARQSCSTLPHQDLRRKVLTFLEHTLMASTITTQDDATTPISNKIATAISTQDVDATPTIDKVAIVITTQDDVLAPTNDKIVNGSSLENGHYPITHVPKVIFVLGGPGSGKGTQCEIIVEKFGFTHLSAGDLLRAEIKSGSENGTMIQNMIKEGKIVPSEVTVNLLQRAMHESGNDKFLIDGFPRNEENRAAFEDVTGIQPEFILFFDCPEEVMEKRLLGRNQGRVDDNIGTIRKRFKVFLESSLPVIDYYSAYGKVRKIDAAKTREEIFRSLAPLFVSHTKAAESVPC